MRADRLIRLIVLLQQHTRLTARDLAQRLEVSERTILRDIDVLSSTGVPVYAERGAVGGFRLLDDYRLDLSGLRTPELRTLLLGGHERLLRDLGWTQDAASAQDKLRYALPPNQVTQADILGQRILIDDSRWFERAHPAPAISPLLSAVWQNRRVAMVYTYPDGTTVQRRLAPYALAAKAGAWYVVAERDGALRTYRLDRVKDITMLDEPFDRPPTFDLRRFWADWTHAFEASRPRFLAKLTVSPAIYGKFLQATPWTVEQSKEPRGQDPDYHVTMVFEHLETAARHIISFTPDVRVIEPMELRSTVYEAAQRIGTWAQTFGGGPAEPNTQPS